MSSNNTAYVLSSCSVLVTAFPTAAAFSPEDRIGSEKLKSETWALSKLGSRISLAAATGKWINQNRKQ